MLATGAADQAETTGAYPCCWQATERICEWPVLSRHPDRPQRSLRHQRCSSGAAACRRPKIGGSYPDLPILLVNRLDGGLIERQCVHANTPYVIYDLDCPNRAVKRFVGLHKTGWAYSPCGYFISHPLDHKKRACLPNGNNTNSMDEKISLNDDSDDRLCFLGYDT